MARLLESGHTMCAGCGVAVAVNMVSKNCPEDIIVCCATSCLEVTTSAYPQTAWNVPWIHTAFETVSAMASGVEAATRKAGKDAKILAIAGDGGTFDIGFQGLSGMLERGHKITQVCLPYDEEIMLEDGSIQKIGNFIDDFIETEGSRRITPNNKILGWSGSNFRNFMITKAHKIRYSGDLIHINTLSGCSSRLTPDHEVLVDECDGFAWKKAGELCPGDEVLVPIKIPVNASEPFIIDLMPHDTSLGLSPELRTKINQALIEEFGSLKKASDSLRLKYWQLKEQGRSISLNDIKKIYSLDTLDFEEDKNKFTDFISQGSVKTALKTRKIDENIMYMLGLLASDGNISDRKYSLRLFNKENALLDAFCRSYGRVFNDPVTSEPPWLNLNNIVLYSLSKELDIKESLNKVIGLPNEIIAAFLKGVFDGDGSCSIHKKKHGSWDMRISITTTRKIFSNRLKLLLQRLGISGKQISRHGRFDIEITDNENILKFIKTVGTNHPKKQRRFEQSNKLLLERQARGKTFNLAPRRCGALLKKICKKYGIMIKDIDENIHDTAKGGRRCTKEKVKKYLDAIASKSDDARFDKLFVELEHLSNGRFFLDMVSGTERVKNNGKYVYDISVDTAQSFVPVNSFVISNCVDNECYANTGVQRSSATPYGAWTTFSPDGKESFGKGEWKKPLGQIIAAHRIPYVASANIGYPQDLYMKIKKALENQPSFLHILSPCPTGWKFDSSLSVKLSRLAVETRMWMLYEIENGKLKVNKKVDSPKPVEEYLKLQGRFKHLHDREIKHIQQVTDSEYQRFLDNEKSGIRM